MGRHRPSLLSAHSVCLDEVGNQVTENSKAKKKAAPVRDGLALEPEPSLARDVTGTGIVLPPAPADRIRRVLWEGQEYAVDPRLFDDVEMMEILADMEDKPFLLVKFVRLLLGDEQWAALKANHKGEDGRMTVERLGEFMAVLNKELEALGN